MTDSTWRFELVPLPDGRVCEAMVHGSRERALVHQPGTPSGAAPDQLLVDVAERFGLSVVVPLRPGYGQSSPNPGRRIADVPADIEAVAAHLGIREFVSSGFSGGGPHSFATAALAPSCKAAAVNVSPAPRDAEGLDYYAGMAESNHEEWALADQGEEAVRPWLEKHGAMIVERATDAFLDTFDDCLPDVDREVMVASAERMSSGLRKAMEVGIEGWLEDDIALTTPWGFDITSVTVPMAFWAGRLDAFVSPDHTVWMAQRVPHADLHLLGAHGHLSLPRAHMFDIVGDLVAKAGW